MPSMSPKQFSGLPFFVYSLLGFREALPSMPRSRKEEVNAEEIRTSGGSVDWPGQV